jgi:hypothetical protein
MLRKIFLGTLCLLFALILLLAALWLYVYGVPFQAPPADTQKLALKSNVMSGGSVDIGSQPSTQATARSSNPLSGSLPAHSAAQTQPSIINLPPPGAPLRETYSILREAAESGNRVAWCRLTSELSNCFTRHPEMRHIKDLFNGRSSGQRTRIDVSKLSTEDREHYERVRAANAYCDGAPIEIFKGAWQLQFRDALGGHTAAMRDFALMGPFPIDPLSVDTLEAMRSYREYASTFIHTAADRGDIHAIYELARAYAGLSEASRPPHLRPIPIARVDKQQALAYAYSHMSLEGIFDYQNSEIQTLTKQLESELTATDQDLAKKWAAYFSTNVKAIHQQSSSRTMQITKSYSLYFSGGCAQI